MIEKNDIQCAWLRGGRQREGTYFVIFIVRPIIAHCCTVAAVLPVDPNLAPREEEEVSWLHTTEKIMVLQHPERAAKATIQHALIKIDGRLDEM